MRILVVIMMVILPFITFSQSGFKSNQLRYERVRDAYQTKENTVKKYLENAGIKDYNFQMFIRIFKHEKCVEIWVKKTSENGYTHLIDYDICSSSGDLGPKRKQGDAQVPEGVYYINRFNPVSNFHLSLGLNYPNSSDLVRANANNPGGDIFIHGSCVTIGCVPLTDDKIMELYILAVEAKEHGQSQIPVHIFPFKMKEERFDAFLEMDEYKNHQNFWNELKPVYLFFEEKKKVPIIRILSNGKYELVSQ